MSKIYVVRNDDTFVGIADDIAGARLLALDDADDFKIRQVLARGFAKLFKKHLIKLEHPTINSLRLYLRRLLMKFLIDPISLPLKSLLLEERLVQNSDSRSILTVMSTLLSSVKDLFMKSYRPLLKELVLLTLYHVGVLVIPQFLNVLKDFMETLLIFLRI